MALLIEYSAKYFATFEAHACIVLTKIAISIVVKYYVRITCMLQHFLAKEAVLIIKT